MITRTLNILKRIYTAPAYSQKPTPWYCLVFTMLSARSRDEQTELVYQSLIKKYPTMKDIAAASIKNLQKTIKRIGLFRAKARNLKRLAQTIITKHNGVVPRTHAELIQLPGVGSKTANCVLVYAYKFSAIPVDTHVHRVTNRLGWVKTQAPEETEAALKKIIPKQYWKDVNRLMVWFGRSVCLPARPRCYACPVRHLCTYPNKTPKPISGTMKGRKNR